MYALFECYCLDLATLKSIGKAAVIEGRAMLGEDLLGKSNLYSFTDFNERITGLSTPAQFSQQLYSKICL